MEKGDNDNMAGDFMANTNSMRDIFSGLSNNVKEYDDKEQQLYNIVNNLSSSWVGADSKAYVNKIQEYKPIVDELGQQIEEFAKLINANATDIDDMVAQIKAAMNK